MNFPTNFGSFFSNHHPFAAPGSADLFRSLNGLNQALNELHQRERTQFKTDNFDSWRVTFDENDPVLSGLAYKDHLLLEEYAERIIPGYLNLSEKEGWQEGGSTCMGNLFTRYMLLKYYFSFKNCLGENKEAIKNVVKAFSQVETSAHSLGGKSKPGSLPKDTRICPDSTVLGWQKHAVSRLVGNLGTAYSPSKPCFEILINSQRESNDDPLCKPFSVSIQINEEESEKRRCRLATLKFVPAEIAHYTFYSGTLSKPKKFLEENRALLGPNSTRLLHGLSFLEETTLPAQKVGNCWIKQPIRTVLVLLFVELLTQRRDLSMEEAWSEAKALYKDMQLKIAIPFVQDLLQRKSFSSEMKQSALEGIERQKENLRPQ